MGQTCNALIGSCREAMGMAVAASGGASLRLLFGCLRRILASNHSKRQSSPGSDRRSSTLSVSADRWLPTIRNTVLAHAGYAFFPALTVEGAMDVLLNRHV